MTDPRKPSTEQDARPKDVWSLQVRLLPFWFQNPQVWFPQVEVQFCLYRTASETTRYDHAASVLPPDVAIELSDVLSAPTGATSCQHLKTKVPGRFMPSKRTRLQHLLTEEDLGNRRPSLLLRRMRQLLEERDVPTHPALLRELFFRRLSQPIRLVLAVAADVTRNRLAVLANQVHEATSPSVTAVLPPTDPAIWRLEARIDELAASLTALRRLPQGSRSTRLGHRALPRTRQARSPSSPPL
ncbi:uncharacterized protein LOC142558328 [Dermacentor variabilis]|uniref:uncharacterized protein LOC142558328 n=1 Tax=Dermacentor variabilis TaxID=34621 RepID=UPI003F5C2934